MPAWTDYTSKTTPADTDEVMIKDFSDSNKANKRMLFSGLWNWIVNKLTNAVIANLETSPQTIVGAINSLNSNLGKVKYKTVFLTEIEVNEYGSCITPLLLSGCIPITFLPEVRFGWTHSFTKDNNISNDYWTLNSMGISDPMTGKISGIIYYLET